MALPRSSSLRRSGHSLKRGRLKKRGHKATMWDEFRGKKFNRDKDEDGLVKCQDYKIGLPACGIARLSPDMDLHHIEGREAAPSLYFAESNLVWLTRDCHNAAHGRNTISTSSEASHDQKRQVEETATSSKVLRVQGQSTSVGAGRPGPQVRHSVSHTDAEIVEQQEASGV